jgi:hypothetical protein
MPCRVILCRVIPPPVMLCPVVPRRVMLCGIMLCRLPLCWLTPRRFVLHRFVPHRFGLHRFVPHRLVLCRGRADAGWRRACRVAARGYRLARATAGRDGHAPAPVPAVACRREAPWYVPMPAPWKGKCIGRATALAG